MRTLMGANSGKDKKSNFTINKSYFVYSKYTHGNIYHSNAIQYITGHVISICVLKNQHAASLVYAFQKMKINCNTCHISPLH